LDGVDKVYRHIDDNIAGHVENLRRLLMQPSVSQTGEGMTECTPLFNVTRGVLCEIAQHVSKCSKMS
jgi:hypothetical protein